MNKKLKTILGFIFGVVIGWMFMHFVIDVEIKPNTVEEQEEQSWVRVYEGNGIIKKIEDKSNSVTCYTFRNGYGGGISCLKN